MAQVKFEEKPLNDQVASFWASRERSGKQGLALFIRLAENLANHGDWNGLAHFMKGAKAAKQDGIVRRLVYHVFGDMLIMKPSKDHQSGFTFTKKWDGVFNLAGSNSFGVLKNAPAGTTWDSPVLFKALIKPPTKVKTVDPARYTAEGKALKAKLDKLKAEGMNVMDILKAAGIVLSADDVSPEVRNLPAQKAAKPLPRKSSADVVEMAA